MESHTTVEDVQFIDGLRFTRYTGNGYYWWKVSNNNHEWYKTGQSVSAHKYVWQKHNGLVPDGFQIHHKDHDASNNDISNLELVETKAHASYHAKKRLAENPEYRAKFHSAGIEAAKAWHKSEEGKAWHKEHAKRIAPTKEKLGTEQVCSWCGKTYIGIASMRKKGFCSMSCQGMARKASGVDDEQRVCEQCGSTYTVNKYQRRRFCSQACVNAHRSWRMRSLPRVQPDSGDGQ